MTLLHHDQFRMTLHSPTSRLHKRDVSRDNNNSCVPSWPGFYLLPFFLMYLSVRRGLMGLRLRMQLDSLLGHISATLARLSCLSSFFGGKSSNDVWKLGNSLILKISTTVGFKFQLLLRMVGFKFTVTLLWLTALFCYGGGQQVLN
jgi:hypothetical protein